MVEFENRFQPNFECLMFFEDKVVMGFGLVSVLDQVEVLLLDLLDDLHHLGRRFERDLRLAWQQVFRHEERLGIRLLHASRWFLLLALEKVLIFLLRK